MHLCIRFSQLLMYVFTLDNLPFRLRLVDFTLISFGLAGELLLPSSLLSTVRAFLSHHSNLGIAVLIAECYKTNSDHSHTRDSHSSVPTSPSVAVEECSGYLLVKNALNRLHVRFLCVSVCALRALNRKQRLEYMKMLISKHTG